MAYTKLFSSIVTSTIWMEDDRTRIVWITMLACADKNGEVQASIPGLARIAGVPVDSCRAAIAKFLSPDADSRTRDDEGRRIEEIDGGWSLLNFRKYREMASKEDSQASEAARKARYRAKVARNVPKCPNGVPVVSTVDPHIAEAEAEAEAKAESEAEAKTTLAPASPPRARNELLDALVAIDGSDPKQSTKSALRAAGVALSEIKAVCPDLTVAEIQRRARHYRLHMPGMTITPHALKQHWAKCDKEPDPTNGNGTHHPSVRKPHRNDVIAGANDPARLAYNAHWDAIAEERDAYGGLTKEQWEAAAARDAAEAAASTGQPGMEEGRACP